MLGTPDDTVLTEYRTQATIASDGPDAKHAVYVVPDGPAQHAGVHILVCCHGVVGQVVRHLELLIQHLANVRVQSVDQRESVVLPAVVLDNLKNRNLTTILTVKVTVCTHFTASDIYLHSEGGHMLPPPGEVFVAVARVLKVPGDVSGGYTLLVLCCDHEHALCLLSLKASGHLLLAGFFIVAALLQLLHALHQHLHLATHLL